MPLLYAMCGLPFAGKSTAARALQSRTKAALVQLDAINAERGLGLDGSAIPEHEWSRTYAEAYRRVAHHLGNGQVVIFDHGNFTRRERDEVRDTARRTGSDVRFVYVSVSAEEARSRWLQNRETHQRYDVRDEDFDIAVRIFEPPDGETDVVTLETLQRELTF
jgi:predicted kinase